MLSENDLKTFLNSLKDRPLEPDDPFYEAYLEKINDPISELVRNITWTETDSVNLLSGQRGSGKSTELRRLRCLLENEGYVVFLCDMQDYINLYFPIEITDFLISIMLALSEAIQEKYGKNFTKRGYSECLKDFLKTEIQMEGIDFDLSGVTIKTALKQDPTIKQHLQNTLRGHIIKVVQQTHDFLQEMVSFVKEKTSNNTRIVLLLDSLEQIRGVGNNAREVHENVQNLFQKHFDKLRLNNLHTVYTVPPYLPTLTPSVGRYSDGGTIYQIPSVHIFNQDGTPDSAGLSVMENVVQRRFVNWQQIFSPEQLQKMILSTGGDFRDFFRLIRIILLRIPLKEGKPLLPVPEKMIEDAKNDLRREMLPIPEDDIKWLRKIAASNQSELQSMGDLPQLARFFDNNLVQNYRNGNDWYDIHPLLKDVIMSKLKVRKLT